MRPRRLDLTAVGSYAGHVTVDFDMLSPFGLFHIHGPTGAGKSSLIDGLCFALYGTVPDPRRADLLRSHHADPQIEARAALEFSSQERDWRIVRTPTQLRGKLRGSGTTEQRATATLLQLVNSSAGNAWEPVASGLKEVDPLIHQLIGLDAAQFMQVVVLPQGGFQRVLRATSEERAHLLSTLFHTERFSDYSLRLKDRAEVLEHALALRSAKSRETISRARERCRLIELPIDWPEEITLDTNEVGRITQAAHLASVRALEAARELEEAQQCNQQAGETIRLVMQATERYHRRQQARRQLAELALEAPAIHQAKLELERARQVEPVLPLFQRVNTAEERAGMLLKTRQSIQEALCSKTFNSTNTFKSTTTVGWSLLDRTLFDSVCTEHVDDDQLQMAIACTRRQSEALHSAVEQAALAATSQQTATTIRHQTAQLVSQLDAARVEAESYEREVDELQQRRTLLLECARDGPRLTETVIQLGIQVDAGDALASLQERLSYQQHQALRAENVAIEAGRNHLQLLQHRLDGIAGELASQLRAGESCAVCGATEHPRPAPVPQGKIIDQDLLDRAHQEAQAATESARLTRQDLDRLHHEIRQTSNVAGPAADDLASVRQTLRTAQQAVLLAQKAEAELGDLEFVLREVTIKHQASRSTIDDLATQAIQASAATTAAEYQAGEMRDRVEAIVGAGNDPRQAKHLVDSALDILTRLTQALINDRQAQLQLSEERHALDAALLQQGVATPADIRTWARDKSQQSALVNRIEFHLQAQAVAEAILQFDDDDDDDTSSAYGSAGATEPDLAAARSASEIASRLYQDAVLRYSAIEREATELAREATDLTQDCVAIAPLHTEVTRVRGLADLCQGAKANDRRMSLERYVLAAYLEEVASAASEQLLVMTCGRYSLRHSDARSRGNAASGLSLLVSDAYTGVEREVSTLSGGETFLASLALALGLSDVVQRHTGGVQIEALFIDEGFGSLDAETLDLAMAELDRLREGGRLVGVISHVSALRERIPVGIEVIPGPRGAHLKLFGCPTPVSV